ncbi:MAG: LacI family DNA-binding transcriptional regulator [Kiritimatiellae bacterium]|nr:LacI family DNA-binding transcriptional regulator [Kiritimatiellia bacterium]
MAHLKDIAEAAGVSIRTVSRVLKNNGYVAAGKRERIEQIAKKLGYRPNRIAQSLRTQRSYHVGFIVRSANELHAQKVVAFSQVLRHAGYLVDALFEGAEDFPAACAEFIGELGNWNPAGMAFLPGTNRGLRPLVRRLEADGMPYIAMDTEEPGVDAVRVDRERGVYEGVRYLAGKGRERIAYLGAKTDTNRLGGYTRALAELKRKPVFIPIDPRAPKYREQAVLPAGQASDRIADRETIEFLVHQRGMQLTHFLAGRDAARAFAAMTPRPDAVQAFSDVVASGFLAGLMDLGIAVPAEVAVVGFDNRLAASLCWPPLTTVAQPNWEVGVAAAEILLKKMAGEPRPKGGWTTRIPCRLIVRESA